MNVSPSEQNKNPEVAHDLESIRRAVADTRRDFEAKTISPEEVANAVKEHRPDLIRGRSDEELIEDTKRVIDSFPANACDSATAVLKDRLGFGKIINGSHGSDDGGRYDAESRVYKPGYEDWGDRYHSFLDLGPTELAQQTIADITDDQFHRFVPGYEGYVGPMVEPWSTSGNYSAA